MIKAGVKEMAGKFKNAITGEWTDDAVESDGKGSWYIKVGFAGFNSRANNLWGYATKESAELAVLRYQTRGAR